MRGGGVCICIPMCDVECIYFTTAVDTSFLKSLVQVCFRCHVYLYSNMPKKRL
jgi:hypothetical protein